MHKKLFADNVVGSGIGVCLKGISTMDQLNKILLSGVDCIEEISSISLDGFLGNQGAVIDECQVESLTDDDLLWMDKATILSVLAYESALKSSNIDLSRYDPKRIAVVLGSSHSGLIRTEEVAKAIIDKSFWSWNDAEKRKLFSSLVSHSTSVISSISGCKGRSITISSACASSNTAIGIGADLIRYDEADLVIAGGCDTVSLSVMAGFNALRALAPGKTAPFSDAIGLNLGEGAGIVFLERADQVVAENRTCHFSVRGYGLSGDAYHATAPDHDGVGAEMAMKAALKDSCLEMSEISYINAHGTGTEANDAAEASAYRRICGNNNIPISSVKSYFGHTLGASGIIELLSAVAAAKNGYVAPNLRVNETRNGCEGINLINNHPVFLDELNNIIVNNYGFGGNNSSLCVSLDENANSAKIEIRRSAVKVSGNAISLPYSKEVGELAQLFVLVGNLLINRNKDRSNTKMPRPIFKDSEWRPFARCSMTTKYEMCALADAIAGQEDAFYRSADAGLISGHFFGPQKATEEFMKSVFEGEPSLASAHYFPMTTMNSSVGQCSIKFQITGYVTAICSSASALAHALDIVSWNKQRRMAVTSSDESTETLNSIYQACKNVDQSFVMEGAAALCIEGVNSKQIAEGVLISAWEICHLGPLPNEERARDTLLDVTKRALEKADLRAQDISAYFEIGSFSSYQRASLDHTYEWLSTEGDLPRLNVTQEIGFQPSSEVIVAVSLASQMVSQGGSYKRILCVGSDLIGDYFAFVVEGGQ